MVANNFLGRGWKFPIQVDPKSGRIMTSEYEEDIEEAIRIILFTSKGERIMNPDFGSSVMEYIFNLTDDMMIGLLESEIEEAINLWEPRVKDVKSTVDFDKSEPEKLLISISYVVRKTNNPYNKVYPFYMNEGTKL